MNEKKYTVIQTDNETGEIVEYPCPVSLTIGRETIDIFLIIDKENGELGRYSYSLKILPPPEQPKKIQKKNFPTPPKKEKFFDKYVDIIACFLTGIIFGVLTLILILMMI